MPQDGELLPSREQHGSLLETLGVVELGQPQEQINIVLALTPLGRRWQQHSVQSTQLRIPRQTCKIGRASCRERVEIDVADLVSRQGNGRGGGAPDRSTSVLQR